MSDSLSGSYSFGNLKVLRYGPGSISSLPEVLVQIGAHRALILTGASIAKSPLLGIVENALGKDAHAGTSAGIGQHSPIAGIEAALKKIDEVGADTIVAVGGGSPIDAAKAVSFFRNQKTGKGFLKIVAIPTTLSAAEYTQGAGYTTAEGNKTGVSDPNLAPLAVIIDAEATKFTPAKLWVSTGLRAVDHSIEALYKKNPAPYPVLQSVLSALPLLFENLIKTHDDPDDLEVRQTLLLSSYLSLSPHPATGALGLSHMLGHQLGATYSIPHGITSCLTLAGCATIVARRASAGDKARLSEGYRRVTLLASNINLEPSKRFISEPGDEENDGVKLAGLVDALVERLGLKTRLEDWNVPREDYSRMVDATVKAGFAGGDNRPSGGDLAALFDKL